MTVNGTEHREQSRGLAGLAHRAWTLLRRPFLSVPQPPVAPIPVKVPAADLRPLRCVRLTEGVARTLFEEYAEHRRGPRGAEETGWVLLGLRERDEATALATLPAGALRDAGVAHVHFNSKGQDVASRIVRQDSKRITFLGVVHTHPGSLRHPSHGDYEGDRVLVGQLRGGEGIFGIGTADGLRNGPTAKPNVQAEGELLFSWYSLGVGQANYAPLPVEVVPGADLAQPLHEVWPVLEEHAERLERLYRQQAEVKCQVVRKESGPELVVTVPLAKQGDRVVVLVGGGAPRYFVHQDGDLFGVDPGARSIDQGVYLLLAELAARA